MASVHLAILQLTMLWVVEASIVNTNALPLAKDGCEDHCGNVSIPYPFGTRKGCYVNDNFLITCNHTYDPPLAFLAHSSIHVTDIRLSGEMRIYANVAHDCYNRAGESVYHNSPSFRSRIFPISYTQNKFMVIGCDTYAVINGSRGTSYTTGCISLCDSTKDVVEGSCSGIGCCETTIPRGVMDFNISVSAYYNHKRVWEFNPCSYAFVAEEGTYNFSTQDLQNFQGGHKMPMVLNWAIGDQNCSEAKKGLESYACRADSECHDSNNGPGYQCSCSNGYQGTPYLKEGCQDIDECLNSTICVQNCTNLPGTYNCSCQLPGYDGDGKWDGTGCTLTLSTERFPLINRISLGIGTILGVLFLISITLGLCKVIKKTLGLCKVIKKRSEIKLKKKFFEKNGGLLFERQLSSNESNVQNTKLFNSKELEKATDNFCKSRIVGKGGYGTVFKGMLSDGRIVAIKKCNTVHKGNLEQFINEIVILSQIIHRNVVKLIGCCLETEIPLLVYEFIPNGTLFQYLHEENEDFPLTWDMRLKIAIEVAGALFYLHSAAASPIYHRDIKSTNILLDEKYRTKVADFGTSKSIKIDQTHVTTLVQGTFGYLDPEYFQTSQFTEKSDVYSFGVVLVELLTGEKPVSSTRSEEGRSLSAYFILSMKENHLFDILDDRVKKEGDKEEVVIVANLAKRCLHLNGKKRPTMREVVTELQGIRKTSDDQQNYEEPQYARREEIEASGVSFTSTQSCFEIASSSSSIVLP